MKSRNFKKTMSPRQIAANQANARQSTGPRTPEGKAVSSRNAAISLPNPLLVQENKEEYVALVAALRPEFAPHSNTEELLFDEIVEIKWQQIRYRQMEKENLNMAATEPDVLDNFEQIEGLSLSTQAHKWLSDHSRTLQILNRQLSRLNREFHKAMDLYLRLHGPLNEPSTTQPELPQPKTNEPIPINEHRPEPAPSPESRTTSLYIRKPKPTPAITAPHAAAASVTAAPLATTH